MRLTPPFSKCLDSARKRALIITFVFSAVLLAALSTLDAPLRTQVAPRGIVSFELAQNYTASRQILDSWNARAKTQAALSLGLDYLFLIIYACFISLACVQVGRALQRHSIHLAAPAAVLAWAQFLAAALDAAENLALIALLLNSTRTWLPPLARWCAIIKFGVIGAGLIYIAGGLLFMGLHIIFKKR